MSETVPAILEAAWSVRTPREEMLQTQIAPVERSFLIKYAQYLAEVYPSKDMCSSKRDTIITEILSTANVRLAVLVKEVNPSITHAVVAVVLYLLSNILTNDHVKYKTQAEMMAVYPTLHDRSDSEKHNLFLTANWMSILFQVLPARKNKGIAMDIIPKFVEGNSANYVTGGGQTQATRDRVFIYETEGNCKPIKRLKRKSKQKLQEEEEERIRLELAESKKEWESCNNEQPRKKLAVSDADPKKQNASVKSLFFPLPAPFFHAQPLPIPAISPRSQSSFSQAASVIANFGNLPPELSKISSEGTDLSATSHEEADESSSSSSSYVVSPRECYLDIEEDGTVIKKINPRAAVSSISLSKAGPSPNIPFVTKPLFLARDNSSAKSLTNPFPSPSWSNTNIPPPPLTSHVSRISSTTSTFDKFVETIGDVDVDEDNNDPLVMLREASADSDI